MGANSSKEIKTVDVKRLEIATEIVKQFLATVLADDAYTDNGEKLCRTVLSALQEERIGNSGRTLLERGRPGNGIFFIEHGTAFVFSGSVTADGHAVVLAELQEGDFLGELSSLYEMACTATVKAQAGSSLYLLPKEYAVEIFQTVELRALPDVVLDRKYSVNNMLATSFPAMKDIQTQSCVRTLQKVPLLRHWSKDLLSRLLQLLPDPPMLLYPRGSTIAYQGDPGGELIVLVRGKIDVLYGKEKLGTFQAGKLPFVFGEEGLFNARWQHMLNLTAGTVCQVLVVSKATQEQLADSVWHFADEVKQEWQQTAQRWKDIVRKRDKKTYRAHAAKLQFEIVYKCIRELPELQTCTPACIYQLAQHGRGRKFDTGDVILSEAECDSEGLAYIIEGDACLKPPADNKQAASQGGFTTHSLLYRQKWMSKGSEFTANSPSLVVKFHGADIAQTLAEHPGSQLNLQT